MNNCCVRDAPSRSRFSSSLTTLDHVSHCRNWPLDEASLISITDLPKYESVLKLTRTLYRPMFTQEDLVIDLDLNRADIAHSVECLSCYTLRQWHARSWTQAPPMIVCVQVHGSKWISCHAGHQEVSRCYTRVESEESTACRWWSTKVTWSTLALKPKSDFTSGPKQWYQSPHKKD